MRAVLGRAYHGLIGGFLLLLNFSVAISVSPPVFFCFFCLSFEFDFLCFKDNEQGNFHANRTTKCLRNQGRTKGEVWSTAK